VRVAILHINEHEARENDIIAPSLLYHRRLLLVLVLGLVLLVRHALVGAFRLLLLRLLDARVPAPAAAR
jgi:hypothetical protein